MELWIIFGVIVALIIVCYIWSLRDDVKRLRNNLEREQKRNTDIENEYKHRDEILVQATREAEIIKETAEREVAKKTQARLKYEEDKLKEVSYQAHTIKQQADRYAENVLRKANERANVIKIAEEKQAFLDNSISNLSAIPYMAKLVADYETISFERLAQSLDWGNNVAREKKVASIRQIRAEAKELLERYKLAEYQLEYLKNLYPVLEDVLETEYTDLPKADLSELSDHDPSKDYLSKEEWNKLSTTERNQLALDRYIEGHQKTKWQIGRDYELYIGYVYERKGYTVDYFGSYMGMEDLGRDLIARKNGKTFVIQCKYWSAQKVIREKHIAQLYGTTMCYCMEYSLPRDKVTAVFCTNISVSEKGKQFADYLGVRLIDNIPLGEFPRIKCNIGKDEFGLTTHIYHLPFDQQYDKVKIDSPGECFAFTVKEAEEKGFRRAYKWFGE